MGKSDQKISARRYQVVPRTLCFITHGDEVLLLRGAPNKRIWPNQYNGVGGHVEREEDVYSAAQREIEEETGLAVTHLRLRGVINIPVDKRAQRGIVIFVFSAVAATQNVRASKEGALAWVSREQLGELDLVEDLPILLPRVLAMKEDDAPFFAHYDYDDEDRLHVTFAN